MSDREILLARLRFLEQSYKRLQELKTQAEQRHQLEMDRLLAELKTASTLRGDELAVGEDGRLPDEINQRLEQIIGHPVKGSKAREIRTELQNLQGRMAAAVHETEQILKFLQG